MNVLIAHLAKLVLMVTSKEQHGCIEDCDDLSEWKRQIATLTFLFITNKAL